MRADAHAIVHGPITWLLVILINVTVTAIIGFYSSQQIAWIQDQVGQWKVVGNHHGNTHPHQGIGGREGGVWMQEGKIFGYGNGMVKREVTGQNVGGQFTAEDNHDEYGSPVLNRNKRSRKQNDNKAKGRRYRNKVKGLKKKMTILQRHVKEMQKQISSMNTSIGDIKKVKSSHFVASDNQAPINRRSLVSNNGLNSLTIWQDEPANDRDAFSLLDSSGRVEIKSPGRYLIYAQVCYRPDQQQPGYTIKRKIKGVEIEHILDTCLTIPNHKPHDSPGQYIMCNTVTVSSLAAHDLLYIVSSNHVHQNIFTEREKTFWGIVRLGTVG